MSNAEFQPYEVYAATLELKAAVEELMLSGKEMIDATNQRGEVYIDSFKVAQQTLKEGMANIRDIEMHQSLSRETLQQIGNTKNAVVSVLDSLKSIQSELTESQTKKFDIVNQNVIKLTKNIEKNTAESVLTAVNTALLNFENKYANTIHQYMTEAKNHMQQLDGQINQSTSRVYSATNSLIGKLLIIALVSGFFTAIFTSVMIKYFFYSLI